MKIRKSVLLMLCCLCVLLAAGTATGVFYAFRTQKTYGELAQLASAVNANYYTDVDEDAVMDGAMKGYVSGLDDPYSQYRTPEEYQTYLTDESGQMVGIGVTVTLTEENYLQVVSLTKDSPAEKAGIQADDIIQAVDGKDVAELGYQDAVQAVRGEPDTKVKLTIQRKTQTLEVEVTRANIEVVTASGQMLDGQIGYIRIDSFKDNTPEQFQAIYDKLIQDGAKALVFDLRDNGGGLVRSLENTPKQRRDKDALADGLHFHSAECRPLCRGEYPEIRHDVPRQADDYRTGENKGAASVLDDGGRQGEERLVRHLRGSDSRNGLSGTFHPLARQQEVPP